MPRIKNTIIYIITCVVLMYCVFGFSVEAYGANNEVRVVYDSVEFRALDQAERDEMEHLLLAKLVYDYLDGFEGKTVSEYLEANDDIYSGEIWKDSRISYSALYNAVIGDWTIYRIFNMNRKSGFYGVAFLKDNHIIYALRGSDMFTDEFPLDESNDWIATDFKFAVLNSLSAQFDDFDNTYRDLKERLKRDGYNNYELTLSGHSLGGALVTYGSLVTDSFGYSFDGACGHVIDLVYLRDYLDIDNFTGVDDFNNVRFVNYTDKEGYLTADLIQHTNCKLLYQIDRKSVVKGITESNFISRIADADSHHIWSCLSYEGNTVFFNEKVKVSDEGYTYSPSGPIYIDITKNAVETTLEQFDITAPWNFFQNFDTQYVVSSALGNVKHGRVVLAPMEGGVIYANKKVSKTKRYKVSTVMYGGAGDDYIFGGKGDDVLIAGAGVVNELNGGEGEDTYIIDRCPEQMVIIKDTGNDKCKIILRNPDKNVIKQLKMSDSGELVLTDNQRIELHTEQSYKGILIYVYDGNRQVYIGTLEEMIK